MLGSTASSVGSDELPLRISYGFTNESWLAGKKQACTGTVLVTKS